MNLSMRKRNRTYTDYSNYTGVLVIYLVSIAVAATVIFPSEEYWYFGILKSILWPFYGLTKFLS